MKPATYMQNTINDRLNALGIQLPEAPASIANYKPAMRTGNLLFIAGQVSKTSKDEAIIGCLGQDLVLEQGIAAARLCALNILAQAQAALGSLDLIEQVIRLNGFINATHAFTNHAKVMNGASDLMVEVLGENGLHTRIAVGVSSLPLGCAVEIDAVFAVKET